MNKKLLLLLAAIILTTNQFLAQNDTFAIRQMTDVLNIIKTTDQGTDLLSRQKLCWRRNRVKLSYYSSENNFIVYKVKLKHKRGRIYAYHKLKIPSSIKIKMTTLDDVPILIFSKNKIKHDKLTFTFLGNSKWYFNHTINNRTKKHFFTHDLSNWR
jgi:hypothetical protein